MAEVCDSVPGGWGGKHGPRARDYRSWFDGRVWALRRGKDFSGKAISAQQGIYRKAREFGVKVRSKIVDGVVYVQAIDRDAPDWTAAAPHVAEESVS